MAWKILGVLGLIVGLVVGGPEGGIVTSLAGVLVGLLIGGVSGVKRNGNDDIRTGQTVTTLQDTVRQLGSRVVALEATVKRLEHRLNQPGVNVQTPHVPTPGVPVTNADAMVPAPTSKDAPATDAPATLPALAQTAAFLRPAQVVTQTAVRIDDLITDPKVAPAGSGAQSADRQPAALPKATETPPNTTQTRPPAKAWQAPETPKKNLRERLPQPVAKLIFEGSPLVKVGVLILFLGLAFLLRYTAEQYTMPVELRYAGVTLAGLVILLTGWRLRNKEGLRREYALTLQGMGVGIFYMTTLAAVKLQGLLSPDIGFVFLALVSLLGAGLAILQNAQTLAVVAIVEGFAAPVLVSTGSNRPLPLFSYLAVLDAGIFLMAWFKAWRPLHLIGFVGTCTLASGWAQKYYTPDQYPLTQGFLLFFFVLFTLMGVLFARRTLKDATISAQESLGQKARSALAAVGRVDSALVFGVPLTGFGMQYGLTRAWEYGPAFSALGLGFVYLLLARLVYAREKTGLALLAESYAIVGALFGTLSIPLGLEGRWTSAAWAIEGAAMYWLGLRQQRPYARLLSFAVLLGAVFKYLPTVVVDSSPGVPVLAGSGLGTVMLAVSGLLIWRLGKRQAEASPLSGMESGGNRMALTIGMVSLFALPFHWLDVPFAAAATAVMGALILQLQARRPTLSPPGVAGHLFQAASVIVLILTLHSGTDNPVQNIGQGEEPLSAVAAQGAALSGGIRGALSAGIIAISLIASVAFAMAGLRRRAVASGQAARWSAVQSISLVVGVGLLHLTLLFGLDWTQAARVWPVSACAVLAAALYLAQRPMAAFAGVLQVVSAGIFVAHHRYTAPEPWGSAFYTPLLLAVAALWSADWLRKEAVRRNRPTGWSNPWAASVPVQWLVPGWALVWWVVAIVPEVALHLANARLEAYTNNSMVLLVLLTSALWAGLARLRHWPVPGRLTVLTLPALALLAAQTTAPLLADYAGWLVWPLALLWHLQLLKWQQDWLNTQETTVLQQLLHGLGFVLFLVLGSVECYQHMRDLPPAFASVGMVLVASIVLWLLRSEHLRRLWPIARWPQVYRVLAPVPFILGLFGWLWVYNFTAADVGTLLPYIPLLNPLELVQWMVLAVLLLWWRDLPDTDSAVRSTHKKQWQNALGGATVLALLTAMVLRCIHHYAGVAWAINALFQSRLAQAAVSVLWASVAVAAMLLGRSRQSRKVWVMGAALLGVVVVKLFLVELADTGGIYRIVSFLVVGVLILAVGYFAGIPPQAADNAREPAP